ncbi:MULTISPECIES: chromosome segregation protein SMC [unclassified Sporosarcina]|uniref:chromosome segregation protein SMC n=1 Tax=unclassified Sporosarcina TaxID=2647733 RepID=UPI00203F2BA4|nr:MULTISPECIES: chromosome segregation protein SMC [unclassified Sporosarcina]GKV64222.1 chromosome partition protein Smc [Sporosarcina sp. NCCP-2331]GLB54313.1 chromosome partition protein Smc [Sporosarcina sp. NCCP-2378]
MFLKRLEITGFKSFAEKIHIDFVPGVTAVVGPNGSGKSNIIDAIRWVLGEQSAKSLRGSKMEDVIFAGSDSRKAVNFAEVNLILDNTQNLFPLDYTEISVSRRVFRSGESAYLLNGQNCRLKDVTSMFMDSGLGKEAFSIISQGRVDGILNSKADERRNVFDEAAGVLKYKTRKMQAEHKLFETTDNLDRVLDILKEIDDRRVPLEKEAATARQAEHFSKELREADVRLLNHDAWTLQQQITEKAGTLTANEIEQGKFDKLLSEQERELESDRAGLQKLEASLDHLQSELVEKTSEAEKWEGRRLLSLEKSRNTNQQLERIQNELELSEKTRQASEEKLTLMQEKQQSVKQELQQTAKEIQQVSGMLNSSLKETEQQIEELKSVYIEKLNEEATLRSDRKYVDERLQGEKSSTEKITIQHKLLQERLSLLKNEQSEKSKEKQAIQQQVSKVEQSAEECALQLKEAEERLGVQQQFLQQALRKQSEMQGRVRALEGLERDFSGFYSGVKEVLNAKKQQRLQGIEGAVAELITTEPAYTKAIETALGGAIQHIVTTTEAEARKAIGFLKAKNLGRATFLPLDILKPRELPMNSRQLLRGQQGFIGTAFELVHTSSAYETIAKNLLGQTIVAGTLKEASAIAKAIGYRYRIVTLDGDVVNTGGSLTGGGAKGQSTVFSRKAELEILTGQLEQMDESIRQANETMSSTREQAGAGLQRRDQLQKSMEELRRQASAAHTSMQETEMEIRSVTMELSTIETGRSDNASAEQDLLVKKQALDHRHSEIRQELQEITGKLESLERLVENRREEQETLQRKLVQLQQKNAVLKEQNTYQTSSIAETRQLVDELTQTVKRLCEEQQYIQGHLVGRELPPEEIDLRMKQSMSAKQQLEEMILLERAKRVKQTEVVALHEQQMKQLRLQVQAVSEQVNMVKIQLSRLEAQYEYVINRLDEEYGLRPDPSFVEEATDAEELRLAVDQFKQQLADLGPVNPNAIQEFEEVSERHQFLTAQRNDLVEARDTLQEAMSEMDTEMKSRFQTTFEAIRSHFHHVYKEMFGGGEADLILTDPSDLLATGIDIVARPPGKKLQNLSLLSGGERALTVISLLFSILEVRPVPFCILDEVEAALDEANVVRYSNYLKKVSEQTQFIVITHRKGTMEGADVLYGVTMQESGVSKLLSVKLSEVAEEITI